MTVTLIFWVSLVLLAYTYCGYPALIASLAWLRPRPVRRGPFRPTITLLIVAHDEAARIRAKLDNCLELDYPRDRLRIVVASDGSTDGTVEEVRRYAPQGVGIVVFAMRRGKPSVLNDVVPASEGEIVVLSDVRQIYDRNVLTALVENFHDPEVGAVSGELVLGEGTTATGVGVGFYWRYEKLIRRSESRFDSSVGATGAVYAIRRELFRRIPEGTLLDDVLVPMEIVRGGRRVVFEPDAKAYERVAAAPGEEFVRKVRTIAGTFDLLRRHPWLWSPRDNRLWFQLVSHKVLRLAGPVLLFAVLVTSVLLQADGAVYRLALAAQVALYGAALAAAMLPESSRLSRSLSIPYAFCLLNYTTLVGAIRFAVGTQRVTWEKPAVRPSRS